MEWLSVDYECLMDKDDYSIISICLREIKEDKNKFYLESVKTFMNNLRNGFSSIENLKRQFMVDFPREICYINNKLVTTYDSFIKEIKYSKLLKEAIMICTQASIYPVTYKLYNEVKDTENNIHLFDFREDNPLIFHFKIFNKKHMSVEIEKKFKVGKIINGDQHIIKILKTLTTLELNKKRNKNVYYIVSDITPEYTLGRRRF